AVTAALFLLVLTMLLRSRRRPVVTGKEGLLGAEGEAVAWDGEEGRVRVHGEIWRARAQRPLQPGARVKVVNREGLVLVVELAWRILQATTRRLLMLSIATIAGLAVLAVIVLFSAVRILREYERGVVFTLGRYTGTKGPGFFLLVPFVQQMVRVDLRVIVDEVPTQD